MDTELDSKIERLQKKIKRLSTKKTYGQPEVLLMNRYKRELNKLNNQKREQMAI